MPGVFLKPLHRRLAGLARWATFIFAALLLTIAVHAFVPPFFIALLALRIVATEAGLWLAIAGLLTALIALVLPSGKWWKASTCGMAVGAGIIGLLPFRHMSTTIARADAALARTCEPAWNEHIPTSSEHTFRARPYALADAMVGIAHAGVITTSIAIPGADGGILAGIQYQGPEGKGAQPVIIVIHGGGWRGGSVTEAAACHRYLAAHGYLVYSIGYRFAPATPFPGARDDVHAALAWVSAHAPAAGGDPQRLILMGRSAGAELALLAAYEQPDPAIRAVVSWYGPVDLVKGYRELPQPDPLHVRNLLRDYLDGTPDEKAAAYAQASPLSYATRLLPPTLLIAAAHDHAVLSEFQYQLRDQLEVTGTPVMLLELPWAEHAFDIIPNGPGAQISLYYLERFLAWAVAR